METSFRRLFWLGAAVAASAAALIAIFSVLSGDFGRMQMRTLELVFAAFLGGSTVLAGLSCRERDVAPVASAAAIVVGPVAFVVWFAEIWGAGHHHLTGVVIAWWVAVTLVNVVRLLSAEAGVLYVVTSACALLAAALITWMVAEEQAFAWRPAAVLAIVAVLGFLLTPIVKRLR